MARRKTRLDPASFLRALRRWSVWGCAVGVVFFALLFQLDGVTRSTGLLVVVLMAISYGLMGLIAARLLVTVFYESDG